MSEDTALAALESKFRRLAELRFTRDMDKTTLQRSEAEYREYEASLIGELEESSVQGTLKFDFGGDLGVMKFQRKGTIYGQIIDLNAALDSFDNDAITDEMTQPKVQARRLNELVRDRLETGQDLPDGIGFYEKKFISIGGA